MRRAALLGASLVVSLLLAELVVRALPRSLLGFEYADGFFSVVTGFELDTAPRNALGMRDVDHGPPQPGTRRVVLLGDSFVAAVSVPLARTVGRRLEHHLNAAGPGRWEVFAWGEPGWGQREQLAFLERHVDVVRPDWVVTLFLSLNDVRNNSDALTEAFKRELRRVYASEPAHRRFGAERAPLFLARGSALNQLVSYRLARWTGATAWTIVPLDYRVYAVDADPRWDSAWRTTRHLLLQTQRTARKAGARYALVSAATAHGVHGPERGLEVLRAAYPAMDGREWDLELADRELARFSARRDIPFVDLNVAVRESVGSPDRLFWPYDGHWNVEGNEVAAREIAAFLLELERAATPAP